MDEERHTTRCEISEHWGQKTFQKERTFWTKEQESEAKPSKF